LNEQIWKLFLLHKNKDFLDYVIRNMTLTSVLHNLKVIFGNLTMDCKIWKYFWTRQNF